jgi:hypothetical protein
MALLTIRQRSDLGRTSVLAPERYDPRRESLKMDSVAERTVPLETIAFNVRQTISPNNGSVDRGEYVVLDTSDVREGVVIGKKKPVPLTEVGSSKKTFQCNDVLISRLRPYLRQVAFVDGEVIGSEIDADLVCSTEFFVLRSHSSESIAFLVPFLLSSPVQHVLAASQEGGHHPRFNLNALLTLPIPESLLAKRRDSSSEVIRGASLYRQAERALVQLIEDAESEIVSKKQIGRAKRKAVG